MSDDITGLCRDHSFETAIEVCRRCGLEFCEVCVVYPFGAKKPVCKECAMMLGGVRSQVTRNALPNRAIRYRVKVFEKFKADRRAPAVVADAPNLIDPTLADAFDVGDDDLQKVPATVPAADTAFDDSVDPENIPSAPPPPPLAGTDPADGVAPPIDWSQPFG